MTLPTAEEFINQYPLTERLFKAILTNGNDTLIHKAMIEFAKLHVKAALEAAAKRAKASIEVEYDDQPSSSMPPSEYAIVNKDSILNAYPETNIK